MRLKKAEANGVQHDRAGQFRRVLEFLVVGIRR